LVISIIFISLSSPPPYITYPLHHIYLNCNLYCHIFLFVTPYPPLLIEKKQKYFVSCFYLKSDLSRFRFVLVLQSKGKEEERVERREKKKRKQKEKEKEKKRKQKDKGSNRLLLLFLCCFQLYSDSICV